MYDKLKSTDYLFIKRSMKKACQENENVGWASDMEGYLETIVLKKKTIDKDKKIFSFDGWNFLKSEVRKATPKEIAKSSFIKMTSFVAGYSANYDKANLKKNPSIQIGCQTITKEQFLAVGRRAGWIKGGKK